MRVLRVVRLIGYALLVSSAVLLAVPFAFGAVTPGVSPLPPIFKACDYNAGDGVPLGHANIINYCGADNDKQSGMNVVCSKHGASYAPPGVDAGADPANPGTIPGAPDSPTQRKVDCAGSGSGTWGWRWLRLCPSPTNPGSYTGQVWHSYQHGLGKTACAEAPPPPDTCDAKEGQAATATGYFGIGQSPEGQPPVSTCKDGCMAFFSGESPAGRRLVQGQYEYYAHGQYKYYGGACQGGDAPPTPGAMPNDSCPTGKVLTTKPDGSKVCVDPATDEEQDPNEDEDCPSWCGCGTKTTKNGDGSVDTTVTTWEGPPGGKACVKKSYHDPDGDGPMPGGPGSGSPPTTEEEEKPDTDGDGNPDPAPDPMEEFCKKNPTNELCKEGSFSGSCSGGSGTFTCDGDAVECSIAKAVNEMNCAFKPDGTTVDQILSASGLDGKETALKSSLNATSHDVGSMLQLNERDLTGSCPAPFTGSVLGGSFEIDVSPLCDLAEILGALLMISAAVVSARIIAGGA